MEAEEIEVAPDRKCSCGSRRYVDHHHGHQSRCTGKEYGAGADEFAGGCSTPVRPNTGEAGYKHRGAINIIVKWSDF
jgi:hypothetical protein